MVEQSRLLVVGASSGIGRAIAEEAIRRGAWVSVSARRSDQLAVAAELAPERVWVIPGDVTVADDCDRIVTDATSAMGGLDCLVYAAGFYRLAAVIDATPDDWWRSLAVNAVGAALVTRAAIPALRAARGRAIYLSSEVVLEPRAGLVPYGASKCALDHVIAGARIECPEVLFTRVIVGATGGTDLGVHTPRETLAEYFSIWRDDGYRSAGLMTPSEVANEVLHLVESEVSIFDLHVQPR